MLTQKFPFVPFHHRWQLLHVANHQQLHPSERLIIPAKLAQPLVDTVQQVGTYHTDLIDHQQVQTSDNISLLGTEAHTSPVFTLGITRHPRAKRKLEKRVNGHPAGIDGRHSRWCYHDHTLGQALFQIVQKGSFSGTCPTR